MIITKNAVRDKAIDYELDKFGYNEANLIMREFGVEVDENISDDIFGNYFRLIKLQLMYVTNARKIKIRTLLKEFVDLQLKR